MSVIFLFIDGIGLGEKGKHNPLSDPRWESFQELTRGQGLTESSEPVHEPGHLFTGLDATLGVEGLPQSGTGQAALFTGENAAEIAGRHYGPWPHSKTRPLIRERSLFQRVKEAGLKPHFINAYPEPFFQRAKARNRWTCTTLMAKTAGVSLNGVREVREGTAVTAEILQTRWRERLYPDIPEIEPEEAAARLLVAAECHDLVLFEYFLTDEAGHSMDPEMSRTVLHPLDRFILHLLRNKRSEDVLVISSDHGNLEDLSVKSHTRNRVPLLMHGAMPTDLILEESLMPDSIMDVPDLIVKMLMG